MVYFDNTSLSSDNYASRIIPLGSGCRVEKQVEGGFRLSGPTAAFVLTTPARDFIFGCTSEEEADGWVCAVQHEITSLEGLQKTSK